MRKYTISKTISLGVIILFIGMSIVPTSGNILDNKIIILTARGNTLYVGGNGSGNYSKIQDAIDNASDGDTVFVYDDGSPYLEWDIWINNSINLIGEDKATTIIDGRGKDHVVNITMDYVMVKGFTIKKSKYLSAGINLCSRYNTIVDNIFMNNTYGILCDHSFYNIIQYNNCSYNLFFGINLRYSRYNNVSYNNVTKNVDDGIRFMYDCKFNEVYNNFISLNDVGVCFWDSNNNTIYENIIYKNGCGIMFYKSKMNIIFENNVTNNGGYGINLMGDSNRNIIYHNNFISNSENGNDQSTNNQYDDGNSGNYWSDYKGIDIFQPYGIGDTPYNVPPSAFDNKDIYPLMKPYPKVKEHGYNFFFTRNKQFSNLFFSRFLERYPLLQSLLLRLGLQ